ncbi:MAG: Cache 3/Cache 2 fusion domain-containing protein, partial [Pirellulales bacterium]|nr:Cache 3/Cache 2 fusion domain-containing protein [Pirellulales bacterium]
MNLFARLIERYRQSTLRTRFLIVALGGPVLMGVGMVVLLLVNEASLLRQTRTTLRTEAESHLASITQGVYDMLLTQDRLLRMNLAGNLKVAEELLRAQGDVTLAEETVDWRAIDQYTKNRTSATLPRMMIGDKWLGQNPDPAVPSPVVDKTNELVGTTCTVFQRMNDAGDMLRVCTNIVGSDGQRAIGTYIPAVNPDGEPNPVVSAILKGNTYIGRAYVVNQWCITAYEPIEDASGKIIGALFVGVPQESVAEVRKNIMNTKVGETGYVYVLGASGSERGKYIVSCEGKRDNENIWDAKDADGNYFIRNAIEKAVTTQDGRSEFVAYPWKNTDDAAPRMKTVAVTYYEPWDWVIGAGTYDDEFEAGLDIIRSSINQSLYICLGATVVIIVLIAGLSVIVSSGIYRVLRTLIGESRRLAEDAVSGKLESRGNPELVTEEFRD